MPYGRTTWKEVAIEVTTSLARDIDEASVPPTVRDWILKSQPTAWDLAVHPGWRELWIQMVRARAKSEAGKEPDFGMNTADSKNVAVLFERVGVQPFAGVSEDERQELDKLVEERGQIVHTGKAPDDFRKKNATAWRAFVEALSKKVDSSIAAEAKALTSKEPW